MGFTMFLKLVSMILHNRVGLKFARYIINLDFLSTVHYDKLPFRNLKGVQAVLQIVWYIVVYRFAGPVLQIAYLIGLKIGWNGFALI